MRRIPICRLRSVDESARSESEKKIDIRLSLSLIRLGRTPAHLGNLVIRNWNSLGCHKSEIRPKKRHSGSGAILKPILQWRTVLDGCNRTGNWASTPKRMPLSICSTTMRQVFFLTKKKWKPRRKCNRLPDPLIQNVSRSQTKNARFSTKWFKDTLCYKEGLCTIQYCSYSCIINHSVHGKKKNPSLPKQTFYLDSIIPGMVSIMIMHLTALKFVCTITQLCWRNGCGQPDTIRRADILIRTYFVYLQFLYHDQFIKFSKT